MTTDVKRPLPTEKFAGTIINMIARRDFAEAMRRHKIHIVAWPEPDILGTSATRHIVYQDMMYCVYVFTYTHTHIREANCRSSCSEPASWIDTAAAFWSAASRNHQKFLRISTSTRLISVLTRRDPNGAWQLWRPAPRHCAPDLPRTITVELTFENVNWVTNSSCIGHNPQAPQTFCNQMQTT